MRRNTLAATSLVLWAIGGGSTTFAADLVWEVESPFRLFKQSSLFAMHEHAFKQVRGNADSPIPSDIIWRTERRLNDPDCKDRSSADRCAATRGPHYDQTRLGWASRTLSAVCYESNGNPRRYQTVCERRYSWGTAREDYILPEAHTVHIALAPGQTVTGSCVWSWQPRHSGGKAESRTQPCDKPLTIARVPFALDRTLSGVMVSVKLPDGRELNEPVIVDDVFVVALGDSFASGESNPDKPVTFSAARQMLYDPVVQRQDNLAAVKPAGEPTYGVASAGGGDDWKVLPRRMLADEERALAYQTGSAEFQRAFDERAAQWFSADCHRSQYGYPFRVGLELALEDRHRAVTLVSLACSGAEVTEGLFLEMPSREGKAPKVRAQFDQLSDLICRGGAPARTVQSTYTLPFFNHGSTGVELKQLVQRWCPPQKRKRPIDLVLLSIGGNDVGFGALALYSITESASDLAPIAGLIGRQIRFPPSVARSYLAHLDKRLQVVKAALQDGFGVDPSRVVQNGYEPMQFDESGALCGKVPTLGMDVHPKLRMSQQRLAEVAGFFTDFTKQLKCTAHRTADCPANLATGAGTGFTLVTEHQPKFAKRGICARNPRALLADSLAMQMPRKSTADGDFKPFSPSGELPYGARWRLFRTPNDAFLTANTHSASISLLDVLQPAYASLYSGAIHPSAEGHAIVADAMMSHARSVLERAPHIEIKPVSNRAMTTGSR